MGSQSSARSVEPFATVVAAAANAGSHTAASEPSLADALAILDLFTAERSILTYDQIVATVGDAAAADAALTALRGRGLLERRAGGYGAGLRALELSAVCEQEIPLIRCAMPLLYDLRDALDETALLAIRWDDCWVCVARVPARQFFHQAIPVGRRKPLHAGAPGRALLSGLSPHDLGCYLARAFRSPDVGPGSRRGAVVEAVARVGQAGFAESLAEGAGAGASFAVPVFDPGEGVMAALAVSVPLGRYGPLLRDNVIQLLNGAAAALTERCLAGGAAPRQGPASRAPAVAAPQRAF